MMNYIAERMGIKTANFIQPMPLIDKPLTEEEKLNSDENENQLLKQNYARMTDDLMSLRNENMPIFSLLDIFANDKETIYRDHIHLNDEGYRIMADVMAKDIGEVWGLKTK
jgi:lysophospholipase L1-like esterase